MANTRRPPRQRGGTFLGIVLGLIVGLAVAVVVALYITKTPTPFVEKTPPRPSDNSPAAQAPDPNKSLQPRTPLPGAASATAAPETASQAVTSPLVPGTPVEPTTPPTASAPTAPATPPAHTKPSPADILNGKSTVPVAPPTTPPASATDNANTGYYLQVGAFKSQTDAEQLRAKLALSGFEAKVTQRDANGLTLYRVRLGPYGKLDEMNHVRQRLQDGGYDTAVIRFTKQ
ncbi:SPOR domain-containing protein [Pandoraea communis]|uniref:SPOR domain-containing protein n=1 Tax=Pandoraea communis TaxID=2508297 RepID=A0A5E4RU72_9BURK|nr:SPOR domain-containing protein [Pandoraea communis]MDM8355350.1 SPOR domain-containing protein [Pandoraea communis]VVD66767.1 SPOR domain-containing protein [Pandoraea communis]